MTRREGSRVLVLGAGVAGLSCARALADAGRPVEVLERARGVGGRCATRRVEGQPVDFGVAFLHGRDPGFLAALAEVPARRLDGWPVAMLGAGRPCQPEAFTPGESRLAFAEGISAFPRHLAAGLPVTLRANAVAVEPEGAALRVRLEGGGAAEAPVVVLALAAEQAHELLGTVPGPPPAVASARALLDQARSQACLALIAVYPPEAQPPAWHCCYPDGSRVLQLAVHDSSKRAAPDATVLVLQAHPRWSREHLDDPAWPERLLEEGGRVVGPWAARPRHQEPHSWRHARHDRSAELAAPLLLGLPGGARLGLCGDRFAPGGGVEAAWRSGRALAHRILQEVP
ncbi:MAG: FAD-dependent oxidoreductase [Deltaproteobacteria bacterium]|nr:FAD-dependent oxidoreductase [Deltaproteobacteria bacterium]